MNEKSEFRKLHKKLKNSNLTEEEFKMFLAYINDPQNEKEVKNILDQEAMERYSDWDLRTDKNKKHPIWNRNVLSVAATILFVVSLVAALLFYFAPKPSNLVFATTNGEILEVWLPDSSFVKLNANSIMEWIDQGKEERLVRLSGEAFFEVRHTETDRAFSVITDRSKVTVLGTSFNINSRENDKIFLEEGSIQLEKANASIPEKVLLKPGESAIVDQDNPQIMVAISKQVENEAAWKDGLLQFSDVRLSMIIQRLEEIYGMDIRVENTEVLATEMEFTLPYTNWEITGPALALAIGLELVEEDGFIILK